MVDKNENKVDNSEILRSLLAAANHDRVITINIARPDENGEAKKVFSFNIHPLSDADYDQVRNRFSKSEFDDDTGVMVSRIDDSDQSRMRAYQIYIATAGSVNKESIWDSQELLDALSVVTPFDAINKVLLPGEKLEVIRKIDEISGFAGRRQSLVTTAKNS